MYGVGYPVMYKAVGGGYVLWFLLVLAAGKMIATSLTIGIGGSGGVFAPSLFIGATSGMAFGEIADHLLGPGAGQPALYAAVAMGAVFAAAARAPLTALASVVEMTGDFTLTLPVMLAVAVATAISRRCSYGTIYTTKLLRRGTDIDQPAPWTALDGLTVADAMRPLAGPLDVAAHVDRRHGQLPPGKPGGSSRAGHRLARAPGAIRRRITRADPAPAMAYDGDGLPVLSADGTQVQGWITGSNVITAVSRRIHEAQAQAHAPRAARVAAWAQPDPGGAVRGSHPRHCLAIRSWRSPSRTDTRRGCLARQPEVATRVHPGLGQAPQPARQPRPGRDAQPGRPDRRARPQARSPPAARTAKRCQRTARHGVRAARSHPWRVIMTAVITADSLTKTFGTRRAVDSLDFEVAEAEVFGFLGPNGAGKSTTIRLLMGLYRPTAGTAAVLGLDPVRDAAAVHRQVGYLPGELALHPRLTGRQHIDFAARARGMRDRTYLGQLVERFGVILDQPARTLSKGNRQKIGIVLAFMHRPGLLILDEPTSGLDPLMQDEFERLIRETVADGRTVFLSSHELDEVQRLADRVAIIKEGRLIVTDTVDRLRRSAPRTIEFRFADDIDPGRFSAIEGVHVTAAGAGRITLALHGTSRTGAAGGVGTGAGRRDRQAR